MGLMARQTRTELSTWGDDPGAGEFAALLDDIAERGFKAACESRILTQGAVLNWLRAVPARKEAYEGALKVKSEVLIHGALEIAEASDDDKLNIDTRFRVAKSWYRERYGEKVDVAHGVAGGLMIVLAPLPPELLAATRSPERLIQAPDAEDAVLVEQPEPPVEEPVEEFRI